MSSCGSCGGSCSCSSTWIRPEIEDVRRDSYDTLYKRCACREVGLTPAIWAEFGPDILNGTGQHSLQSCIKVDALPMNLRAVCAGLGVK